MDKRKVLRIVTPVLIVLIILGIWAYKNFGTDKAETPLPSSGAGGVVLTEEEKIDFALDAASFDLEKLKSYGLPIIIDFGAEWCGPCRDFKPVLEAMHAEMLGKAIIKYVDTDTYAEIARDFPVTVIPTQVFIGADGAPYVPGEGLGVDFSNYTYKDSGETAFTVHEGSLTAEQLRAILTDMGVGA